MEVITDQDVTQIANLLADGAVGVLRTDTLYGIICVASNESSVQRIYQLKGRDDNKPPIVLVANQVQLYDEPTAKGKVLLDKDWPGPVSVVLPSQNAPRWIRRTNDSVAYRLPDNEFIQALLRKTGPLIAPSANPQNAPAATSIQQAIDYFGEELDFYVDGGEVGDVQPSKIYRVLQDGKVEQLR